jgi:lysophospholipase L1-like esterase
MPNYRATVRRLWVNLLLAGAAVALTLAASEVTLRLVLPSRDRYYVNLPLTDMRAVLSPRVVRGVDSAVRYQVNADGIRGRSFGPDSAEYRILAVGGSTTECLLLNYESSWPALLEQRLARTIDGRSVWVGNVGRSAMTSREHVLHLKYLLAQYPRIDAVVVLVGINDMLSALRQGSRYTLPRPITEMEAERRDLRRAFASLPHIEDLPVDSVTFPWYHRTALWDLARRAKAVHQRSARLDNLASDGLVGLRERRAAGMTIDTMPSLETPLVEYRRNLMTMADIAAARHVRLVFSTQSFLWRNDMSSVERHDLWLGSRGPDEAYYSPRVLAQAMGDYNAVTMEVCKMRSLDCIDAASAIPHSSAMFYDDVHFTNAGSRQMAVVVAEYFSHQPPFGAR